MKSGNGCNILMHAARCGSQLGMTAVISACRTNLNPSKVRISYTRHCRDARVYGHAPTAMHEMEYISSIECPPPPSAASAVVYSWAQVSGLYVV